MKNSGRIFQAAPKPFFYLVLVGSLLLAASHAGVLWGATKQSGLFVASDWMQLGEDALTLFIYGWALASLPKASQRLSVVWASLCIGVIFLFVGDSLFIFTGGGKMSGAPQNIMAAAYLLSNIAFLVGFFLIPNEKIPALRRLKILLDLGIVALSVAMMYWNLLLDPLFRQPGGDFLANLMQAFSPLTDIAMLLAMLSLVFRPMRGVHPLPFGLLAGAVAILVLLDSASSYLIIHGELQPVIWVEAGWLSARTLAILAGLAQISYNLSPQRGNSNESPKQTHPLSEVWTVFIPYGFLAVDVLFLSVHERLNLPMDDETLGWWVTGVALMVGVRQAVVYFENSRLFGDFHQLQTELEQRVLQRTFELTRANGKLQEEIILRNRVETALVYRMHLEQLAGRISARLVKLDAERLDEEITHSLGEISEAIHASRGFVYLLNQENEELTLSYHWRAGEQMSEANGLNGRKLAEIPWLVVELSGLHPFFSSDRDDGSDTPLRSFLTMIGSGMIIGAPLVYRNKLLGFMAFDRLPGEGYFPDQDLVVYALIADVFVQAMARRTVERDLLNRTNQLEALRQINLEMTGKLQLKDVLLSVTDWAVRLVEADSGVFFLYDSALNRLRLAVTIGSQPLPLGMVIEVGEGLSGEAFRQKEPQRADHYPTSPQRIPGLVGYFPGGVVSIPVHHGEDRLGVLAVSNNQVRTFSDNDVNVLRLFAAQAAIAIQNAQLYEKAHNLAITDPLTEVYNRRHFFEVAAREIERAERYHENLATLIMDLDYFKQINDTYGHLVGDEILRELVGRCQHSLRDFDLFSRYGGEEFIALLPATSLEQAVSVAERLRKAISDHPFDAAGHLIPVTVSIGISILTPQTREIARLLRQADAALYRAKNNGRNQVMVFDNSVQGKELTENG